MTTLTKQGNIKIYLKYKNKCYIKDKFVWLVKKSEVFFSTWTGKLFLRIVACEWPFLPQGASSLLVLRGVRSRICSSWWVRQSVSKDGIIKIDIIKSLYIFRERDTESWYMQVEYHNHTIMYSNKVTITDCIWKESKYFLQKFLEELIKEIVN